LKYLIIFLSALFFIFSPEVHSEELEKVRIVFKWKHGFQFAGYYAAKEKGFYKEEGLDVDLLEFQPGEKHYINKVSDNDAEYGVADTGLIWAYSKGKPVVMLSQIFQHSPMVFFTLKSSGIINPYQLAGKKVSTDIFRVGNAQLHIMFLETLGDFRKKVKLVKPYYDYNKLINKEVDAMGGYITDQPFWFKSKGVEINIINPQNYGIDFYGDNFFTNKKEIKEHPERVKKMMRASLKGWNYALDHPDEIIELILKKYNTSDKTKEHLEFEANATAQVIARNMIPLGDINLNRFNRIIQAYYRLGLVDSNKLPDDFIYTRKKLEVSLSKKEKIWLRNRDFISFSVPVGHEPYIIENGDGSFSGIIPDFIKYISRGIGTEIRLAAFKNGSVDGHDLVKDKKLYGRSVIFDNSKNRERYLITSPYMNVQVNLVARKDKVLSINSKKDLEGRKVAVFANNITAMNYLNDIKNVQIVPAGSLKQIVEFLRSGEADAAIVYSGFNYFFDSNNIKDIYLAYTVNKQQGVVFGISKDYPELHSIINKAIESLSELEKLRMINRWQKIQTAGFNKRTLLESNNNEFYAELNYQEKELLDRIKEVKMCVDPNWMPFEKLEGGKHLGMTADYMKLIQQVVNVPIKVVPAKTWLESLEIGKRRECDIFSLVMPTDERRKFLNFTKPYLKSPLVIVTKVEELFVDNIASVTDRKIGIAEGYAYGEILRKRYPEMKLINVKNIMEGLEMVKRGELFGFIETLATVGYQIQKGYIGELKIAGKFDEKWELGIGTRNDMPVLNSIFNKAIDRISEKQMQEIVNKWISVKYESAVDYSMAWKVGAVLLLVIGLILYKNRTMKMVNNKLQEAHDKLEEQNELINSQKDALSEQQEMVDKYVMIYTTSSDGIITSANEAFCKASGYTREQLIGANHNIIRHPDMPITTYQNMWDTIKAGSTWEGEVINRAKDGSDYWVNAKISPTYDEDGKINGFRSLREDITLQKKVEELSVTDTLTGLNNRLKLDDVLEQKIYDFERYGNAFSIILIDLDHFKEVNDNYGHDVGDYILKEISRILKDQLRKTDVLGRWGGEEFVIICSNTSLDGAVKMAEKLRKAVEKFEFKKVGQKTISLGVVEFLKDETFKSVFKRVDELLYAAKQGGRNQVKF